MKVNRALSVLSIALALLCSNASADIIDLTTADAFATPTAAIGGVFRVEQIDPQSTGTGVIDPFLRIQGSGNEQGYNTDTKPPEFDTKAGTWTHALLLANVPTVTIGSVSYRQFLLDVNQNSGGDNEILSLNQVQLFQSGADVGTGSDSFLNAGTATTPPVITFAGATEVFRMNNPIAGFTEILLDYSLNDGSGSGDMFLYVRNDAFGAGTHVTMYSQFGASPGGSASNDGFEEWATIGQGTPLTHVPEPASVILLGSTLLGLCHFLRKRFAR
jgi:hypothetical protein